MKLVKTDKCVINFEDDKEADRYIKHNPSSEIMSSDEVLKVFGQYGQYAGPNCTSIDQDGSIQFDIDSCIDREQEEYKRHQRRVDIITAKDIDLSSMTVAEVSSLIDSILDKGSIKDAVAKISKMLAIQMLR